MASHGHNVLKFGCEKVWNKQWIFPLSLIWNHDVMFYKYANVWIKTCEQLLQYKHVDVLSGKQG